jgi:O-acetyl-ADP-ribose deacetylase (regulator of RNase III)
MTVEIAKGDLLEQRVDAIVNTVNTVGVMGKGIALQFRRKWPANYKAYGGGVQTQGGRSLQDVRVRQWRPG